MTSSVSVAMATFNGAKFLAQQLSSIAAQSRLPDELVVSDDGSTDETIAILEEFARTAAFRVIILKNQPRLNFRGNFIRAARRCTSDVIAFCDQDDAWRDDKLMRCLGEFDQDPDMLLLHHNARMITEDGVILPDVLHAPALFPRRAEANSLLPWTYGFGFTICIRSTLIPFVPFWEATLDPAATGDIAPFGHDQFFFFAASGLGRIGYLDEALADYRQHAASLTTQYRQGAILRKVKLWLADRADFYDFRARSASWLSAMFAALKSDAALSGSQRNQAGTAEANWRALSEFYAARQLLYNSRGVGQRVHVLRSMIKMGAYKNEAWALGSRALLKDAVHGLLANSVIGFRPSGPAGAHPKGS